MRTISMIVIHCSDTPDTMNIGAAEIRGWHTAKEPNGRGWADIGYHLVVRRSGTVELGRTEATVGAGVKGHNARSLHICWVGRWAPTSVQNEALLAEVLKWCRKYDLPATAVVGHCELDPGKTCPNINMRPVRAIIETMLKKVAQPAAPTLSAQSPAEPVTRPPSPALDPVK